MEGVDDQKRAILSAFVLRARRVEAHSLVQDRDNLIAFAQMRMKVRFDATGHPIAIERALPAEEALESLAARLRPVILEEESTYFEKAAVATQFFARENAPTEMAVLRSLRAKFKDLLDPAKSPVITQIGNTSGALLQSLGVRELANGWLYGDLVHADHDRHSASRDFDIGERFGAAAGMYSNVAILTVNLLGVVRKLQADGVLQIPDTVFSEDVIVRENPPDSIRVFVAEVGAEVPEFDTSPDDAGSTWRPFSPAQESHQEPT